MTEDELRRRTEANMERFMTADELVVSVLAEHRALYWSDHTVSCMCQYPEPLDHIEPDSHRAHVASAVLAALGIEQVGWIVCSGPNEGRLWGMGPAAYGHSGMCPDCVPVYRLKALEEGKTGG